MNIRYHHLMCIPRFQGKGYSEDFCKNMAEIKAQMEQGEKINLVSRTDDICKYCPNQIDNICKSENKVLQYDLKVKEALEKKKSIDISKICYDCEWYSVCKEIKI